jgi:8-oxo-dGTP diphosphatase
MIDVVCGVVRNDKGEYLITQRGDEKNYGKWEFPGGKLKENELPFDSIKRELLEELELKVNPINEIKRYTYKQFNLIFILCVPLNPDEIKLKEHLELTWVKVKDFKKYNFLEGDLEFIKNYIEGC